MEVLIKLQEDILGRIEKARKNYKKSPKERLTEQYAQTRVESLEHLWSQFVNNHSNIVQVSNSKDLNSSTYVKDDVYDVAEQIYVEFKCELICVINKSKNKSNNNKENTTGESNTASGSVQFKLPKITIPTFSGKYTDWTTFRDLFTSLIHDNLSLSNVQKLHYLKGYLSGDAEQLIRHVPITESDYVRSWDLLKSRYDNKRYLANNILKRFLSQKYLVAESSSLLRDLIDTTNDCLSALTNIGVDVRSWDILVIHILTLKLDPETRKQWELKVTNSNSVDELPTFMQFQEFITNRYRALEFLEPGPGRVTLNKNKHEQSTNYLPKPKVFHTSTPVCRYCNENHNVYHCRKFASEDVDTRRKFAEQNRICFLCLGSNHSAKFCRTKVSCRICRRKHHTLLHPKGVNLGSCSVGSPSNVGVTKSCEHVVSEEAMASTSTCGTAQVVTCFSSNQVAFDNQVLLATALVRAESSNGDKRIIRALLDQGSQASFITEATVQYLGIKKIPVQGLISGLEGNKNISVKSMVKIKLHSRMDSSVNLIVQAYVLKSVTTFLSSKRLAAMDWLALEEVYLADPQYHTPNKIDILLGAEVYGQILQDGVKKGP